MIYKTCSIYTIQKLKMAHHAARLNFKILTWLESICIFIDFYIWFVYENA